MTPARLDSAPMFPANPDAPSVEWRVTSGRTDYEPAVAFMEARAQAIAE